MHYVWVLRDMLYAERSRAAERQAWADFRNRWRHVLGLPAWAAEPGWWRHPAGEYRGDRDYCVHPCHRTIGRTQRGLRERINRFGLEDQDGARTALLIRMRKIINTECDCLIQTPQRLIVVECKDKTSFLTEQRIRQQGLFECLQRLLPRKEPLFYVEVASCDAESREHQTWSWKMLNM